MKYSEKQLKEAELLVFLMKNTLEPVDVIFEEFTNTFISDKQHELIFIEKFNMIDPNAPWILFFSNGNAIIHYEGCYIGVFSKNYGFIFKNEYMMRKDGDFDSILLKFCNKLDSQNELDNE